MKVDSYLGYTSTDAYVLRFTYSGTNLNVPDWKISVKVLSPILSSDGKVFPPEKLSFSPTGTSGQAQPGAVPSIAEIGMPMSVSLNGIGNETFLVPKSNAPLYNVSQWNSYYDLRINYNLVVAPGIYLNDLQGGDVQRRYRVPFEFNAYGPNNELLGTVQMEYTIDVFRLTDNPVPENKYSIQIGGGAHNGLLELKSLKDYVSGARVSYANGLIVSSNTDYQISVRSVPPTFTSASGYTLPLDVVNLRLTPTAGNAATTKVVQLSNITQIIADGISTNNSPVYFDLEYYTNPNNEQLIQARTDEYTTTLLYEITPQ